MKIAFLGDLAVFDSGLLPRNWTSELKNVRDFLMDYDLVVANLEAPITEKSKTLVCKGIHLRTSRRIIKLLQYLNVRLVCLANNHIFDYGIKGFKDTLKILDENNIYYYGVDNKCYEVINQDVDIVFHGYCCYSTNGAKYISKNSNKHGVDELASGSVEKDLLHDKESGKFSVLSFHWGDEYSPLPNSIQYDWMHELSLKYSFLVHGHHAHVIQGIERVNTSLIAYNMGNFCFDECHSQVNPALAIKQSEANKESFILSVKFENNVLQAWDTQGIFYGSNGIKLIDNKKRIAELSKKIVYCHEQKYKDEAIDAIKNQKDNNLPVHDFKWLLSKMNYYSIVAKLLTYVNKYRYKRAMKI